MHNLNLIEGSAFRKHLGIVFDEYEQIELHHLALFSDFLR